jgi:hypothetical protein
MTAPAIGPYLSVKQVALLLGKSENTIRRRFADYPGVIDHGQPERRYKRRYRELGIPESAIQLYLHDHKVGRLSGLRKMRPGSPSNHVTHVVSCPVCLFGLTVTGAAVQQVGNE